ncbi:MAG TPA: ABC transporter permease [Candidatus Limnocylindria bacterium]|nr:ABC transporter permease [Candidatus Limnocylindria bacterium]
MFKRPLGLHVVQRGELSAPAAWGFRLLAVLAALAAGGLFLLSLGYNPFSVYASMIGGSLGTAGMQRETIKLAIPLALTSLGVLLAFKMRFWNIGAEGQFAMGAIAASYFAYFQAHLPSPLLLVLMALAAVLAAGLWGLVPAWFKTRFGTNETLFTLMLNYIVFYLITFLREGPWREGSGGFAATPRFPRQARLPEVPLPFVGNIHIGWIVLIVMAVLVFVYLKWTKHGYEITVVGENERTARYAGMPVKKIVLRTMFLSAAVCGLAGMLQVAGPDRQLTDAVAGGRGFQAVSVVWLARLSPFGSVFVSFLFAIMQKGSSMMQTEYRIPASMSDILQGIVLFCVLGAEFFLRFSLRRQKEALT